MSNKLDTGTLVGAAGLVAAFGIGLFLHSKHQQATQQLLQKIANVRRECDEEKQRVNGIIKDMQKELTSITKTHNEFAKESTTAAASLADRQAYLTKWIRFVSVPVGRPTDISLSLLWDSRPDPILEITKGSVSTCPTPLIREIKEDSIIGSFTLPSGAHRIKLQFTCIRERQEQHFGAIVREKGQFKMLFGEFPVGGGSVSSSSRSTDPVQTVYEDRVEVEEEGKFNIHLQPDRSLSAVKLRVFILSL
eukprot:TRINITY_DN68049_c1_g1_i1.p1 TRINITY_DN68049_c1_g1~~TRINITY_DN68049_c1_g1_i1.p1  ORF type:complete len:249 (-),score=32.33 TRINITY_DN68049_c1_g1_i1:207-953(-)